MQKGFREKLSEALYLLHLHQFSKNYSTIVATLPDPTVRPPSRLNVNYIYLENLDFTWFLFAHISCFASFLVIFEIFRAILEPNHIYVTSASCSFETCLCMPPLTPLQLFHSKEAHRYSTLRHLQALLSDAHAQGYLH